jgi:hypothetical protein
MCGQLSYAAEGFGGDVEEEDLEECDTEFTDLAQSFDCYEVYMTQIQTYYCETGVHISLFYYTTIEAIDCDSGDPCDIFSSAHNPSLCDSGDPCDDTSNAYDPIECYGYGSGGSGGGGSFTDSSTLNALMHYYTGNGEAYDVGDFAKLVLRNSTEFRYVLDRLEQGTANERSSSFDVDMELVVFHIGDTNVDYSTSCDAGNCTTTFRGFVNDSFSDPLDIGIEGGGTPFPYIPYEFTETYPNPGYPIGTNIN